MADGTNRGELAIGGLDAMLDVVARLETRRWPGVADLGCGRGGAALAIAAEFWDVLVDGFDSDAACLAEVPPAGDRGRPERTRALPRGRRERLAERALRAAARARPGPSADALAGARAGIAEDGVVLMARERGESSEALREHATAVGFAGVEELPLEHRSLRLVRLSA